MSDFECKRTSWGSILRGNTVYDIIGFFWRGGEENNGQNTKVKVLVSIFSFRHKWDIKRLKYREVNHWVTRPVLCHFPKILLLTILRSTYNLMAVKNNSFLSHQVLTDSMIPSFHTTNLFRNSMRLFRPTAIELVLICRCMSINTSISAREAPAGRKSPGLGSTSHYEEAEMGLRPVLIVILPQT